MHTSSPQGEMLPSLGVGALAQRGIRRTTESAAAAGHREFTLRELEVVVFQMVRLNAAVQGRTIRTPPRPSQQQQICCRTA